jgi:hypothetical protein
MSKRHKNKTAPENSAVVVPHDPEARTEAGVPGASRPVVRLFREEEADSGIASMRTTSNKEIHLSVPAHAEHIIRRRAYELYEKRGCEDGHAEEDWLRAEAEVLGSALRKANVG